MTFDASASAMFRDLVVNLRHDDGSLRRVVTHHALSPIAQPRAFDWCRGISVSETPSLSIAVG
eukprot:1780863-Rhodomonas_salina.1